MRKRILIIVGVLILVGLLLGSTALALLLERNGENEVFDSDEGENVASAPAPSSPLEFTRLGEAPVWAATFDTDPINVLPTDLGSERTGPGSDGTWVVLTDSTAPSSPNVLAQTSTDATDGRFPMAIALQPKFRDLEASVKFKAVSGRVDQAGGLVFRFQDASNYYLVRANALENNYRLYRVVNGQRTQFGGSNIQVTANAWHTLRIVCLGDQIEAYFDGQRLMQARDDTFKDAGRVGMWTKADSVTYFDDLQVWEVR